MVTDKTYDLFLVIATVISGLVASDFLGALSNSNQYQIGKIMYFVLLGVTMLTSLFFWNPNKWFGKEFVSKRDTFKSVTEIIFWTLFL